MREYTDKEKMNFEANGFVPIEDSRSNADGQQTFFGQNDDGTYRYDTHESCLVPVSRIKKKIRKKQRHTKTWLVAFASAVAGALVVSVATPFISKGINTLSGGHFAFGTTQTTDSSQTVSPVTYNSEDLKPLTTVEIGKTVGPSVVGIVSQVESQGFFQKEVSTGSGSGIIFTNNGHIVTNYHVIEGASSVKVVLNTGEEYDATLVGSDERTDLAVIKIDAQNLTPAVLGDSTNLEAGETVVAIGNPLGLEFAGSLSKGIISAVNRTVTVSNRTYKMIQTDAAINPGNSGGALVNEYGQVIGINSVKVSSDGVEGMGFAIPISEAKPVIEDIMNYGYVKGRPLIGLSTRFVTEQEAYYYNLASAGLFVVEVTPGSGAEKAGIQKGDIVISCDGTKIDAAETLNNIRDQHKAGDVIKLTVNRDGQQLELSVTLGEDIPAKTKQ